MYSSRFNGGITSTFRPNRAFPSSKDTFSLCFDRTKNCPSCSSSKRLPIAVILSRSRCSRKHRMPVMIRQLCLAVTARRFAGLAAGPLGKNEPFRHAPAAFTAPPVGSSFAAHGRAQARVEALPLPLPAPVGSPPACRLLPRNAFRRPATDRSMWSRGSTTATCLAAGVPYP